MNDARAGDIRGFQVTRLFCPDSFEPLQLMTQLDNDISSLSLKRSIGNERPSPDAVLLSLATLLSWRLVIHGTREYPLSARSARIQSPYESDRSSVSAHPSFSLYSSSDTQCTFGRLSLSILSFSRVLLWNLFQRM